MKSSCVLCSGKRPQELLKTGIIGEGFIFYGRCHAKESNKNQKSINTAKSCKLI